MKTLFAALALLCLYSFSACNKEEEQAGEPGTEPAFSFLKPGNEWIYDYKAGDVQDIVKYKILAKEPDGYYKVNWFMGSDFEIYWHAADGAFSNLTDGPGGSLKLTLVKFNSSPGASWSDTDWDDDFNQVVTLTNKVIATDVAVSTPAGSFNKCFKVHQTKSADAEYYVDYFISPVYGIVKIEGTGYMKTEETIRHFPLSYTLKSKNF